MPAIIAKSHTPNKLCQTHLVKSIQQTKLGLEELNVFNRTNKKTYLQLKWIDCIQ